MTEPNRDTMTQAELNAIRRRITAVKNAETDKDRADALWDFTVGSVADMERLLSHIDTLTAALATKDKECDQNYREFCRVNAELEREKEQARRHLTSGGGPGFNW